MRKLVLMLLAIPAVSCNEMLRAPTDDQFSNWGRETLQVIERDHHIKDQLGYYEDQTKKAVAFTWSNSMLLLAYAKAAQFDQSYEAQLAHLVEYMDGYWVTYNGIGGYDHLPHPKEAVERYYDDNAWIAMGLIDAYHSTGKEEYLELAKRTIRFCLSGIDKESGGVWWREYWENKWRKTKNTCSVAPVAFSCLRYYEITNEESYLETAIELMTWLDHNLKDKDHLYFDHIRISGRIGRKKWTYNSAMPLRCYVLLYKLTDQKDCLDKAVQIAKAAQEHWCDMSSGAIKCESMFAYTLIEGWIELSQVTDDPKWESMAKSTMAYVHKNVRDPNGRYSRRWDMKNIVPIDHWKLLYPAAAARGYWVLAVSEKSLDWKK